VASRVSSSRRRRQARAGGGWARVRRAFAGGPETPTVDTPAAAAMIRRVGVNSAWLILQPLLLNLITLAAMGYITRRLGRAGYGLFNFGFAHVAAFTAIANVGLRTVAVRAIAERRDGAARIFTAFLVLRLGLAALVALLALGSAPWTPTSPAGRMVITFATLSMALSVLTQSFGDAFRGFEKMRPVALADMAGGLTLTLLSVLALALGYGLWGFTVAYVAGAAVGCVLIFIAYLRAFGMPSLRPEWPVARSLLLQARPFVLMQLVTGVTDKPVIDLLILNWVFGPGVVGPYAAVAVLVNRLGVIPEGVTGALFPAVAGGYQERRAEVEQAVRKAFFYLVLVTLPIAVAGSFLAPVAVRLLFGPAYRDGAVVLAILIWVVPLLGPNLLMYDCLSAVRRQGAAAAIALAGGLIQIALFAVFIPACGTMGAAASTVGRELILFAALWREMRRSFRDPVPFGQLRRALPAFAVLVLPMALALATPSPALRVAAAALGAALYGIGLLKLKVL
jgi:O-antigen/teichoic acid export membrane protein